MGAPWSARLTAAWAVRPPSALARALQPLGALYALLAALHRALYAVGLRRADHPGVPVIVVGNLVAGGAGKTPTVIHLVQALRAAGWTPGIVSRGYGGQARSPTPVQADSAAHEVGDEPLLMHLRTGAPVLVAPRRAEAARALRRLAPQVDVIVADDGLQHHALARDVQVIVFDERGVGNGLRLPAGPLREALPEQPDARSVVLYHAAAPSTPWPGHLATRTLGGVVLLDDWWAGHPASRAELEALRGRPLVAAAGLARPQAFFAMLRAQGLHLAATLALRDHHRFDTLPWPADAADVVVTEKDAVKLRPERVGHTRVWVAPLDFQPAAEYVDDILRRLPARPAAPPTGPPMPHEPRPSSARSAGMPTLQGPAHRGARRAEPPA